MGALTTALAALRDCVADALTASVPGWPANARVSLHPGELAWDDCACGLLGVGFGTGWTSRTFPVQSQGGDDDGCPPPYLVRPVTVTVLRCAPGPDRNGNPPTVAQLQAAALDVVYDLVTVRTAVGCCLAGLVDQGTIADHLVGAGRMTGPEGGCGGSTLDLLVALANPCPCPTS